MTAEQNEALPSAAAYEKHDDEWRGKGFPWCDTCQHAAVFLEGRGFMHSTPEHPFGHPRHSDPHGDHEVTMREWSAQ